MATRTAPPVTAAVTSVNSTLHVIDASGDLFTDNLLTLTAPTTAEVEAWAASYQGASQSSLWQVSSMSMWTGAALASNADVGQRNTIAEGINMLWKSVSTLKTQNPRLVAPISAVMQGNLDIPLLSATQMVALTDALQVLLTTYAFESAQFTGRRERKNNPRTKP